MRIDLITGLGRGGAEAMLVKLAKSGRCRLFLTILPGGELRPELSISAEDLGAVTQSLSGTVKILYRLSAGSRIVVVTWMYHADLVGLVLQLLLPRIKVIWNLRNSLDSREVFKPSTHRLIKIAAALSRMPFCVVSNSSRAIFTHRQHGYRLKNPVIIPNGFTLPSIDWIHGERQRLRSEWGIADDECFVGLVARYAVQKNVGMFFDVIRILSSKIDRLRVVIIGEGMTFNNPKMRSLVESLRAPERVILAGKRADSISCIASLDLLCLTSDAEGFPNVVGEALSCGVPCVTTDVGDCRSIIGECGSVVPRLDSESFAAACVEQLARYREYRNEIVSSCRDRIMQKFTLEAVGERYEVLLKSVERYEEEQVI